MYKSLGIFLMVLISNQTALCQIDSAAQAPSFECVDRLSAANLGRGSITLSKIIAERCLEEWLRRYHSETSISEIKSAEKNAPYGNQLGLMGTMPGIGYIGDGGIFTLHAEQNFDCHAVHPAGDEMVCNEPISRSYREEDWPFWRDTMGKTRAEYDAMVIKEDNLQLARKAKLRSLFH